MSDFKFYFFLNQKDQIVLCELQTTLKSRNKKAIKHIMVKITEGLIPQKIFSMHFIYLLTPDIKENYRG